MVDPVKTPPTAPPMNGIDRVRQALAMADAGFPVRGIELMDAEELLAAYDRILQLALAMANADASRLGHG